MIVLDASVVLEVLLRMPAGVALEERLFEPEETLHAPHLLDVEVAQVPRRYALAGEVEALRCRAALDDLASLPLKPVSARLPVAARVGTAGKPFRVRRGVYRPC